MPTDAASTPDLAALALPHVAALHAYTPGLQPTEPGWVKLNTNECPYPPSPLVAAAIAAELGGAEGAGGEGASLRLYPEPTSAALRAAIAAHHGGEDSGLGAANVCVGNGSDDILNLLVRCFCGAGVGEGGLGRGADSGAPNAASGRAGFSLPSYSLYPVLVGIANGQSVAIEFDRTMALPVEKIASSGASIFFLTSPNAPTGVGFGEREIEAVLAAYDGLLVVDEAYAPFARESALKLLARYPRLVVVRTFSKAYALAGIRVGYCLAHPQVIALLDRVRDSYNVSRLSQVAALAALSDTRYYAGVIRKVAATRDAYLARFASEAGWFTYPSQANFIFTEPRTRGGEMGAAVAQAAYDFLCERRVLVRHFPKHALTAPFLRISVGTDEQMLTLWNSLQAWLHDA
ncbi:histidinol phosphate aminotransferase [Cephaloticoccus primus]|uniref:Histidinol-phosphate aminotransferase n=1 Tax=Cephaloticoccus primus TaxID=1548207 RepID=A0A139SJW4_9BACT|nr:histidinol-phosphate transaminase [Cephaloticoccus primus]KXU34774.1 histidinol phosphate aminotransferase [Cephaloticoccus primus]